MGKKQPKIVFWGTPYVGSRILEALIKARFCPILVVTAPDKPKGRGLGKQAPEVKRTAIKRGLDVGQPAKLRENEGFLSQLKTLGPDLCILASYGKIIPKEILEIPKKGFLNVHPSLLPRWRGASPIQATILAGDQETGVTIILMDEEMDHGDIVASSKLKTQISKLGYKELEEKLIEVASELLIKTLPHWVEGKIKPIPQDHSQATFCKIIKKIDGKIDFNEPAGIIERKTRAYEVWPGAWFEINGKTYKILATEILKDNELTKNKKPGKFFCFNKELMVKCKEDALIIKKIQPESKKPMAGYEFWCGYQKKLN